MVLHLRALMEHLRYRRSVPCLSSPVDFNTVPVVQRLVAAFRLVFALRCPGERVHKRLFQQFESSAIEVAERPAPNRLPRLVRSHPELPA